MPASKPSDRALRRELKVDHPVPHGAATAQGDDTPLEPAPHGASPSDLVAARKAGKTPKARAAASGGKTSSSTRGAPDR
jgi:hypothetical protein